MVFVGVVGDADIVFADDVSCLEVDVCVTLLYGSSVVSDVFG